MPGRVTIGVPIYRGEAFLAEALRSIQAQTFTDWQAILSLDGPDHACEAICREFLSDSRFRVVNHRQRLGWVGQLNWLLAQVDGEFWYYHQQDDLTAPEYLATLVGHAERHPEAAIASCDLVPFGRIEGRFEQQPSITGATPFTRVLTVLRDVANSYQFRGVTRADVVRRAGPAPDNERNGFCADLGWLVAVARCGEIHRVPLELYRKRYHGTNTESAWWAWDRRERLRAWPMHCMELAAQALRGDFTVHEARLLWLAAVERLTSPQVAGHFLPLADLAEGDREGMLVDLLARAKAAAPLLDLPMILDAGWPAIDAMSRVTFHDASREPITILDFGPRKIRRGRGFNVQPDGRSAVWVKTSRRAFRDVQISVGGATLETYHEGTVYTAFVPEELIAQVRVVPLVLIGRDGRKRSSEEEIDIR